MAGWAIKTEKVTDDLLEDIMRLDRQEYPDCVVNLTWYLENYTDLEFITTCRNNTTLVGYACVTGIDSRVYECYKEGLLRGDVSLAPASFKSLKSGKTLYLSMVCVDTIYQRKGIAKELLVSSMASIKMTKGLNFSVIAICTVKHMEKLLLSLNFKLAHDFGDRSVVELKKISKRV